MNKFKLNLTNLILTTKETFNNTGEILKTDGSGPAIWTDNWAYFPNQKRMLLHFSKWADDVKNCRFDLVRTYALEYLNRNLSVEYIIPTIQYATRVLKLINKEIWDIEQSDLNSLICNFKEAGYSDKCAGSFWKWCKANKLIPEYLRTPSHIDLRNRSPDEEEKRDINLLPSDESIAAIGVVYNELYSEEGLDKYGFKKYPKEYLGIAFSTIALSTPSRANIEIWGLPNQNIKTVIDKETGEETHSLFWKGSKKHPDNQTLILSELKENVKRIIEVLEKESLPAKIISYFMANTSLSLNKVMQAYPIFQYKLSSYPNLNYESKTSIFHLGLILGFYDKEPIVPVFGNHDKRIPVHFNQKWKTFKYLSDVKYNEKIAKDNTIISLYCKNSTISSEAKYHSFNSVKDYLFEDKDITSLSKLTDLIIKANIFLNGSVDTITKGQFVSTKISDAMFVYTASTLNMHTRMKANSIFETKTIPIPNMYNLQTYTERPMFSIKWIKSALDLVGLKKMAIPPHQLRHWVNHHAKESGIPISVINLWSGRKDADQAYEYIHTIDEDNAKQINSILVNKSEMEPSSEIKLISIKKIKNLRKLPATIMSEGVCTQDLVTMPCRFLNDFMTSCFGCQEMCYIKGDIQGLSFLKMDLEVQIARLSKVKSQPGFIVNKGSQKWYKTHFNKTSVLTVLIDILEDDVIPEGASVRMSGDLSSLEFRIQNFDTTQIAIRQFSLEDSTVSLNKLLVNTESNKNISNPRLANLLGRYGVQND